MIGFTSVIRVGTVAALAMFTARGAHAQAVTVNLPPSPAVVHTTNTVVIAGTFSVTPGSVVQNSIQGSPCNPGACYDAAPVVHANRGWQLQVTLNSNPSDFSVAWIDKAHANAAHPLAAGVYQTIATGTTATPAQTISAMYNATRATGKSGFVPTAAQVAAVLTYRVIANP